MSQGKRSGRSNTLPLGKVKTEETSDPPKKARRTFLTQSACQRCRQKKSKCDGNRPKCGRCDKHGTECVYDVTQEGVTKMQHLQQRLDLKSIDNDRLLKLISSLSEGTDHEATTLLARLRLGENLDHLLVELAAGGPNEDINHDQTQSQDDQSPMSTSTLPQSPLDNESWQGWARRREALGSNVVSPSDGRLAPHRKSEPSSPAHLFEPPDDTHHPESGSRFSSAHWQNAYAETTKEDVEPSRTVPGGPYYVQSDQFAREAMLRDRQLRMRTDDPRSKNSQGRPTEQRQGDTESGEAS